MKLHNNCVSLFRFKNEDYVFDVISEEHAEHIYNNWIYKDHYSPAYIRELLQTLPAIGAYVKQSGASQMNSKLVAWALAKPSGEIGIVTTLQEHRGKGLITEVTLKLAKILLEKEIAPFAITGDDNIYAIRMLQRLGFEKEETVAINYNFYEK